jgi:hypothetical protein
MAGRILGAKATLRPGRGMRLRAPAIAFLALTGCVIIPIGSGNLIYRPPTGTAAMRAPLEAPTTAGATRLAAERMRAGGLKVTSISTASGRISARASDGSLVDCGTFTQTAHGNTARFPASAPLAVIFSNSHLGGFYRREARVESRVTVTAAPGSAVIAERHEVTLRRRSADGKTLLGSESRSFTGTSRAKFSDGTICMSSGRVADLLR